MFLLTQLSSVFQATGMELNLSKNGVSCGEPGTTCSLLGSIITSPLRKSKVIYTNPETHHVEQKDAGAPLGLAQGQILFLVNHTGRACPQASTFTRLDALCLLCGELMRRVFTTCWYEEISDYEMQMEACGNQMKAKSNNIFQQRVLLPHIICFIVCLLSDDGFLVRCFAFGKKALFRIFF